ncbi:hypothetical protein ACWIUD_11270, partial [Helicobacter sp. 23-1044]
MRGGGGFCLLNAIELSEICKSPDFECKISDDYTQIQNTAPFSTYKITIQSTITTFTNTSEITSTDNQTFNIENNGKNGAITHFINRGKISGSIFITTNNALNTLENYGEMRGVWAYKPQQITIQNFGTINTVEGSYFNSDTKYAAHFIFEDSSSKLLIKNYAIKITESASEFNAFQGYVDMRGSNKNSHLLIYYGNVAFKDGDSKIILDFGDGFEFGGLYKTKMLVTKQDGNTIDDLGVDFSRLALKDADFYDILESGEYFIVKVKEKSGDKNGDFALHTPITELYKSNLRTMNNFQTMTN